MRLLQISGLKPGGDGTLELVEYFNYFPEYAILSHTWGTPKDEVLFDDIAKSTARDKKSYRKLQLTADQALRDGIEHIWIDTCCIDKSSSAELQEAINSMYKWYKKSAVCYIYLEDIATRKDIGQSRWFTRGWTLQELLAPRCIIFYSHDWSKLGTIDREHQSTWAVRHDGNKDLVERVAKATSIAADILLGIEEIKASSIATRMSWAAHRRTTREEDIAYCLLGIFDVNMPLLYGEGPRAFLRLQEEILRRSADSSIFLWNRAMRNEPGSSGSTLLAVDPFAFQDLHACDPGPGGRIENSPFTMTSLGVQIQMPLIPVAGEGGLFLGVLNSRLRTPGPKAHESYFAIYLKSLQDDSNFYTRVYSHRLILLPHSLKSGASRDCTATIFVPPADYIKRSFSAERDWNSFIDDYTEPVRHIRLDTTALVRKDNSNAHCEAFRKTAEGWETCKLKSDFRIVGRGVQNTKQQWEWEDALFSSADSNLRESIAFRLSVGGTGTSQRYFWFVLHRTRMGFQIVALEKDAKPYVPRKKFRVSTAMVFCSDGQDYTPVSSAANWSQESKKDFALEFGYELRIEEVEAFDNTDRRSWRKYLLHHSDRGPSGAPKASINAAFASYSEEELERSAIQRSCRWYKDRQEMLEALMETCNGPTYMYPSEMGDYKSKHHRKKACRCCILLQPASESRYAEVIA